MEAKKLSEYLGFKNNKAYVGMYSLLEDKLDTALRNAKRLVANDLPPSGNVSATNVYELMKKPRAYLK